MNHPTFIQWNCRGFRVNFNEISLLIQNHNSVALCLQETHLKDTDNTNIKNYTMYITTKLKQTEPLVVRQ